ncbi:hypothetical protein ACWD0J_29365 [Streptomyces sp. NPDC003011]
MPSTAATSSWGSPSRAQRDRCPGRQQPQHVDAEHCHCTAFARGLVRPDS